MELETNNKIEIKNDLLNEKDQKFLRNYSRKNNKYSN